MYYSPYSLTHLRGFEGIIGGEDKGWLDNDYCSEQIYTLPKVWGLGKRLPNNLDTYQIEVKNYQSWMAVWGPLRTVTSLDWGYDVIAF